MSWCGPVLGGLQWQCTSNQLLLFTKPRPYRRMPPQHPYVWLGTWQMSKIKTCAIDMVEEVLNHDDKRGNGRVDCTTTRRVETLAVECLSNFFIRHKES